MSTTTTNRNFKYARLLNHMRENGPMTHKDMVRFLLRGTGTPYTAETRTHYDGSLYGDSRRVGILERFCWRRGDGKWQVRARAKIQAPFVPFRTSEFANWF